MSWRDAAGLAFHSAVRRLGRTALTVSAIALAAALLTALLSMTVTARTRVLDQLTKGGPLSSVRMVPAEARLDELDQDNPRPGSRRPITATALRRVRALRGVDRVIPIFAGPVDVVGRTGEPVSTNIVGADLRRASHLPVSVLSGRLPSPGSLTEVAVTNGYLDSTKTSRARPGQVIGKEIELLSSAGSFAYEPGSQFRTIPRFARYSRARIVGVVAQEAAQGKVFASSELVTQVAQTAGRYEAFDRDHLVAGAVVVADSVRSVGAVRRSIARVGYSTNATQNLIASVLRYLHVVELVLGSIAVITVIVAGLGIANAMFAAVRERGREIGILKAIGARDRDVRRVFLLESAVLGLIGGSAGTMLGWGIARGVGVIVNRYLTSEGLAGVSVSVTAGIVLLGIGGSALLSLGAGTIPAWRAASVSPKSAVER